MRHLLSQSSIGENAGYGPSMQIFSRTNAGFVSAFEIASVTVIVQHANIVLTREQ
jgi:hypothetical protein